jgi:hypothetical protein
MGGSDKKTEGHLLIRMAMWSAVSLPCFWLPIYYDYRYPITDSRLGMLMGFFVPFLGLAVVLCIRAMIQLQQILHASSRRRRGLLTLLSLLLSAPALSPIALVAVVIIRSAAQP